MEIIVIFKFEKMQKLIINNEYKEEFRFDIPFYYEFVLVKGIITLFEN